VSVVIPFHGSADVLRRALASVHDQDFTEPIQTIVVVDGDGGDLSKVKSDFSNVAFIHQNNSGPGSARNRGIDAARGEFIAFLDADDVWAPSKLSAQIEQMRREGSSWSQHSYAVTDPHGAVLRHVDTSHYRGQVLRETLLSFRVQTSSVMVRRACFADPEVRFGDDRVGEDGHLYVQLAARYPLHALTAELARFTWHGANAGGRADVQLWSRARTWRTQRSLLRETLPLPARIAYAWCAVAASVLRFPRDRPPQLANDLPAKLAYLPSYLVFQLAAR
jgi:glycosyltransferase involved in cell wall biosynthesis